MATPLGNIVTNMNNKYNSSMKNYQNSANYKQSQGMINASIGDISKKYGFDFSREYANRQAEAEAQAKRNAYNSSIRENDTFNKQTMGRISADVKSANSNIDNSYFQQYLQQRQQQANNGINSGIMADQNLRLGMAQQGELADVYRDSNLARQEESQRFSNESIRLKEALGLVEQEKLSKSEQLYQDRLGQAYGFLSQERQFGLQLDQNEWKKLQDKLQSQFNISKMDADRIIQETQYSGSYGGKKTVEQLAREFAQSMQEKQLQLEKDKFAYQKQIDAQRLAAQKAAAAAAAYRPSSKPSGTTSTTSSKATGPVAQYQAAKKSTQSTTQGKYYTEQARKYKQLYDSQPKVYQKGKTYLDRNPVINKMVNDRIFSRPNLSIPGAYF